MICATIALATGEAVPCNLARSPTIAPIRFNRRAVVSGLARFTVGPEPVGALVVVHSLTGELRAALVASEDVERAPTLEVGEHGHIGGAALRAGSTEGYVHDCQRYRAAAASIRPVAYSSRRPTISSTDQT